MNVIPWTLNSDCAPNRQGVISITGKLEGQYTNITSLQSIIGRPVIILNITRVAQRNNDRLYYFNAYATEAVIIPINDESSPLLNYPIVKKYMDDLSRYGEYYAVIQSTDPGNTLPIDNLSTMMEQFITVKFNFDGEIPPDLKLKFMYRGNNIRIGYDPMELEFHHVDPFYKGCPKPSCRKKALDDKLTCTVCGNTYTDNINGHTLYWKFDLIFYSTDTDTPYPLKVLCNDDIVNFLSSKKYTDVKSVIIATTEGHDTNDFIFEWVNKLNELLSTEGSTMGLEMSIIMSPGSSDGTPSYILQSIQSIEIPPPR
jgi:hypothetical protein